MVVQQLVEVQVRLELLGKVMLEAMVQAVFMVMAAAVAAQEAPAQMVEIHLIVLQKALVALEQHLQSQVHR